MTHTFQNPIQSSKKPGESPVTPLLGQPEKLFLTYLFHAALPQSAGVPPSKMLTCGRRRKGE